MNYIQLFEKYEEIVADVEAGILHEDYIDDAVYAVVEAYCKQRKIDSDNVDFSDIFDAIVNENNT